MGLFRKKPPPATPTTATPAPTPELDALRAELDDLRERLDASERGRLVVEQRLAELDDRQPRSDAPPLAPPRSDGAETPPPPLPSIVRLPESERERIDAIETRLTSIDRIHERLNALSATVAQQELANATRSDGAIADESLLNDISNRVEDLSAAVASHYTQIAAARDRLEVVDDVEARIVALQGVIDSLRSGSPDDGDRPPSTAGIDEEARAQLAAMAERLAALDERVTSVSLELANQLTELSGDLELVGAGERGVDDLDARIESSLEAIRSGQERLAAEQARYEIQFRADLADLAERLRRS